LQIGRSGHLESLFGLGLTKTRESEGGEPDNGSDEGNIHSGPGDYEGMGYGAH